MHYHLRGSMAQPTSNQNFLLGACWLKSNTPKNLKEIFHITLRTIFSDSISAPHQPPFLLPPQKNPLICFHF